MSSPTGTNNESIEPEKESNAAGVAEEEPLKCNDENESGAEGNVKEENGTVDLGSKGSYHGDGDMPEGNKEVEANEKEEIDESETCAIEKSSGEKQIVNGGDETEEVQEESPKMSTGEHVLYPG